MAYSKRNHPRALVWIRKHRKELEKAGYDEKELHSHILALATLQVWNNPDVKVEMRGPMILFSWNTPQGNRIVQTFQPAFMTKDARIRK